MFRIWQQLMTSCAITSCRSSSPTWACSWFLLKLFRLCFSQIKTDSETFGPFCGKDKPADILSSSQRAEVTFYSDLEGTNQGFTLEYKPKGRIVKLTFWMWIMSSCSVYSRCWMSTDHLLMICCRLLQEWNVLEKWRRMPSCLQREISTKWASRSLCSVWRDTFYPYVVSRVKWNH